LKIRFCEFQSQDELAFGNDYLWISERPALVFGELIRFGKDSLLLEFSHDLTDGGTAGGFRFLGNTKFSNNPRPRERRVA